MFDINLNESLNSNSSELLFKRGCEHLIEKGVYGYEMSESRIEYDEFDFSRKVKELAALMKEKLWYLFYVLTASDRISPALCEVNSVFKTVCSHNMKPEEINDLKSYESMFKWYEELEYDEEKYQNLHKQNLIFITRIWERTCYYFNLFLEKSPAKILGEVDSHFSRKEFQIIGSTRNKSHVHRGVSVLNSTKEEFAEKIFLDLEVFFHEQHGISFKELLEDELVEGDEDFEALQNLINQVMIYICEIILGCCMKVVGEDTVEICRVLLHLWSDENYFEEKHYIYSE